MWWPFKRKNKADESRENKEAAESLFSIFADASDKVESLPGLSESLARAADVMDMMLEKSEPLIRKGALSKSEKIVLLDQIEVMKAIAALGGDGITEQLPLADATSSSDAIYHSHMIHVAAAIGVIEKNM